MNELLKGIGERLRIQRKNMKLTQAQTAELLEMSTNFYGEIERGERRLSLEKILLVQKHLGMDPTFLLTGETQPQVGFYDIIADCPKEKIFDMEQIVRYASNLYRDNK